MTARSFHPLTVTRVDRLTSDSAAITFGVPAGLRQAFTFAPGQFLTPPSLISGSVGRVRKTRVPRATTGATGTVPLSSWWQSGQVSIACFIAGASCTTCRPTAV